MNVVKIDILDIEKLIDVNNLQEVTSANLFSSKMIFDPDGLLSNEIFGISKGDRRTTFAYIDLKRPFIHPHLYAKVVKALFRNVMYIVSGQKRYVIQDGYFVEDNENGWTGLASLYDHWDEIKWNKSKSTNTVNKELLTKLSKDQVFITKILVCPPAYRDVTLAGTIDSSDYVNELNKLYSRLLRSIATLSEGGLFARRQYATQSKIQDTLVEIFDYFKGQISKKHGLIRQNLLGKSVDFGTRTVISAPNYNNENFEDNMISVEYTAVPISECCSTFYPFIESWVKNFFTREVINDPNKFMFYEYIDRPGGIKQVREVTGIMKEPELQFSDKKIKKMINDYCRNPDNRFQPINIKIIKPLEKGEEEINAYLVLKGKMLLENNANKVLNRAMTVTDLLYLACVDVCEKRHVMVSRYPVGTDKGIFFSRVRVQSTAKHIHLVLNGVDYPFYPDIDLNLDHEKVGVQFIDTLVMSNSHLDGMGADLTKSLSWSATLVTMYKNKLVNA